METQLKTTISADTAGFIQAINAATSAVGDATDNWASRVAVAQNSITAATVSVTDLKEKLEAAGRKDIGVDDKEELKEQMKAASEAAKQAADSIGELFQKITEGASQMGTTAQEFQELQAAADAANVPIEDIASAMGNMNTVMREAANSNEEVQKTLSALGLQLEDLQSLSPAEQMRLLQVGLDGVADETKKAELATKVFGQSHQQVASMCQVYGTAVQDAHQRGAIATQKQIDALRQLQQQAKQAFQTVTEASATATEKTRSLWEKFKGALQGGNMALIKSLKMAWKGVVDITNQALSDASTARREETEANERNLESVRETSKANQQARSEHGKSPAAG